MVKICKYCGKQFETNNPQQLYCSDTHFRPCPVCGKPVAMIDNDFSRPRKCCSPECAQTLRQQKLTNRICKECGKAFQPNSGSQTICNQQHVRTCEICGKEFLVSRQDIYDNVTTCSEECRTAKQKARRPNKYTVTHLAAIQDTQRRFEISAKDYHNDRFCELIDTLTKHKMNFSLQKKIGDTCYDLCIEDTKIVIDYNSTYTHNIIGNAEVAGLGRNYHLERTKLAESQGFRCIHIFDWDDVDKVVSMLKPRQSIYARNCEIYRLNLDVAEDFLNEYHLQGSCRGQLLCLGLVKDGTLYQVMTFGKSRYDSKHDIQLLRFCTLPGYSVTGGASKLFSYATSEYALNNIISYCDRSKFTGSVYEKIGMKLIRTTPPQEVWSKGNQKITANLLRQRGYDQLFKTNYGKGASNEMLMLENGWAPVTDCGQLVYEFKI